MNRPTRALWCTVWLCGALVSCADSHQLMPDANVDAPPGPDGGGQCFDQSYPTQSASCACPPHQLDVVNFNAASGLGWCAAPDIRRQRAGADLCSGGYVVPRFPEPDSHDDPLWGGWCVTPALCRDAFQRSLPEHVDDGCVYSDLTTARTGVIAPLECESLLDGYCAVNCPCPGTQECWGLSEGSAQGVCVTADIGHTTCLASMPELCGSDRFVACMVPAQIPDWVASAEDWNRPEVDLFGPAPQIWGRCVSAGQCGVVANQADPPIWRCVDPPL